MATRCSKCGAAIEEGWSVCRSCFEPVKREGLLVRLARFLSSGRSSSASPRVNINLTERIRIRDPLTGETREYRSLNEVPEQFREQIRKLREARLSGTGGEQINVTDASGKVQTYRSVDELPPDLRALYEKVRPK